MQRRGFSLLEVMLATAILLGSIVVLGELARLGSRNVQAACNETVAERLAQSVMNRVTAAGTMPEQTVDQPLEETQGWLYSIEIEPLDRPALSALRIRVAQDLPEEKQPVQFTLVRWMRFTPGSDEKDGLRDTTSPPLKGAPAASPAAPLTPLPSAAPRRLP